MIDDEMARAGGPRLPGAPLQTENSEKKVSLECPFSLLSQQHSLEKITTTKHKPCVHVCNRSRAAAAANGKEEDHIVCFPVDAIRGLGACPAYMFVMLLLAPFAV